MDNSRPAYRILSPNGFYGPNDHLFAENDEIYFDGEPNEEMEPLNDAAHERLSAYLEKLDNLGREAAAKAGKTYTGRPRNLDGALALATAVVRADMALMGAKKDNAGIDLVSGEETPEVGTANPKRGRGRPKNIQKIG